MIAKRMKMIAVGIFVIAQAAGVAFGVPSNTTVTDVRYTVHNLSNNNDLNKGLTRGGARNYSAPGADQVCIFCHTPHNASPAVPLWNKVYPEGTGYAEGFRLYTSSATLSSVAKAAKLTASSESLLCLSCHDGKTAINVLHNSSYRSSSDPVTGDAIINIDTMMNTSGELSIGMLSGFGDNAPNLGALRDSEGFITDAFNGTNLTDDHPIGFSYTGAATAPENAGQLKPTPDAGIRLFGDTRRVECSSCHNPHIYYGSGLSGSTRVYFDLKYGFNVSEDQKGRTPFLTMSNSGSKLCLGCHIK